MKGVEMLQRIIIRNTILWLRDKISYVGLAVIWILNSVYLEFTAYRALQMVPSEIDVLTYLMASKLRICAFKMSYSVSIVCKHMESSYRIYSISQAKYNEAASVFN